MTSPLWYYGITPIDSYILTDENTPPFKSDADHGELVNREGMKIRTKIGKSAPR